MSKINKVLKFAYSAEFRSAKLRHWVWPLFRAFYPDIRYVGFRGANGDATLVFSDDKFITIDFIKNGTNTTEMKKVFAILREIGAPLGGCFFDIGANIGTETIKALRSGLFDRAVAIEPAAENLRLLRSNLALNSLADRVKVFSVGASNCEGSALLTMSHDNSGDHRIAKDVGATTQPIVLKTADQVMLESGETPESISLVWIDTQGYEGFVLAGAENLMRAAIPFVIEFTPDALKDIGCYDMAIEAIKRNLTNIYDLSTDYPGRMGTGEIDVISARLANTGTFTDLLLL